MRLFGSERIASLMDRMGHKEGEVIQHGMVSKSIERAQKKVEENNFGMRKRLLEYDDVMNAQREGVYRKRKNALSGERLQVDIANMAFDLSENVVSNSKSSDNFSSYQLDVFELFGILPAVDEGEFKKIPLPELSKLTFESALKSYSSRNSQVASQALPVLENVIQEQGKDVETILVPFTDGKKGLQVPTNLKESVGSKGESLIRDLEKSVVLSMIDESWKDHLRNMDDLRQNVQGAVYEQKDPLLIYKHESFGLFKEMLDDLNKNSISFLFNANLPKPDEQNSSQRVQRASEKKTSKINYTTSGPGSSDSNNSGNTSKGNRIGKPIKSEKKYGRNDIVTITNITSGEQKNVKYKIAEPLLSQGWVLL
jgi:preprotein translocase subunit SecA